MFLFLSSIYDILFRGHDELKRIDLMAGVLVGLSPIVHLLIVSGINAPYGRYTSSSWGLPISAQAAWFLQEIPALVIPMYLYLTSDVSQVSLPALILLGAFSLHYANRSCIYPFKIKGGKPTPLVIMFMATFFCICNGYMQASYLLYVSAYRPEYLLEWNFVLGLLIFCFGAFVNITCDDILRNLRKDGSTGYKIPHGNMFEYLVAANLWGEAVEWCGWGLACWSLQGFAFACFAVMYLSSRSYSHYTWYNKKFEDFPKDRKIFIPFLI